MLVSNENSFLVSVELAAPYSFLVEHYFYDQYNNIQTAECLVEEKVECYRYRLRGGIYTFRIIVNGTVKDDLIIVDKPLRLGIGLTDIRETIKITLPELYTSVPLRGKRYGKYASSPDYLEASSVNNSILISKEKETFSLMLRYPSKESYLESFKSQNLWSSFSLLDQNLKLITDLEVNKNATINEDEGWMIAKVQLSDGLYFLQYKSTKNPRLVPIHVHKEKNVFIFLTLAQEAKFGTLRIFSLSEISFPNDDSDLRLIDLLLDKLNNHDYNKSGKILQYVQENTTNVFLKLIAKYLYIGSLNSKVIKDIPKIELLDWLNKQSEDSEYKSDEATLKLILVENDFLDIESIELDAENPPVIRMGFEALLRAATADPTVLKSFSLMDYIAENLLTDSPYTTFSTPKNLLQRRSILSFIKNDRFKLITEESSVDILPNCKISDYMGNKLGQMHRDIKLERKDTSWVLYEVIELLESNPNIDINSAANVLNIPSATLLRTLENEKKRGQGQLILKTISTWTKRASILLIFFIIGRTGYEVYDKYMNTNSQMVEEVAVDSTSAIPADSINEIPNNLKDNDKYYQVNKLEKYNNDDIKKAYLILLSHLKPLPSENIKELKIPDSLFKKMALVDENENLINHTYLNALHELKKNFPKTKFSEETKNLLDKYEGK